MLGLESAVFIVAKRPSERRCHERSSFVWRVLNKQDEGQRYSVYYWKGGGGGGTLH